MTVTYTAEVATCKRFGCFIKLLARWRGSIYKLVWMDLLLFLFLYYSINMIYIFFLSEESRRTFESIVYYCSSYSSLIPLSFVLGFYVNLVMTRWWEQYTTIPWPDSVAVFVSAHVHGQDEGGRVMRRTVMRYVCLCLTIVFTMISPCVKKRFPKLKHLVDAGLLLESEQKIIETMDTAFPKYPKHWMPIIWAASIITRARNEGRIRDDFAHKTIIDELNLFRGYCGTLMYYDCISIPLVYTQVVTIAVYSFFVCSLLAHQWTEHKRDTYESFDFSMPIFITMEFFFYMGWLKVAETLINPFGEDDDDFEVNWMIDRNLQVSYLIVDEMHHEHPELVKDQYWDEVYPTELPYEANAKREQPPESSTAKYGLEDSPIVSTSKGLRNADRNPTSMLSIRSERFKQTFQRYSQFSEEDGEEVNLTNPSPNISLTDVESVQYITSYGPAVTSEESIALKVEHFNDSLLITVPEMRKSNAEIEYEGEEEYDLATEEQEDVESASALMEKSDSDSDPFERLRLQRQQERIKRTNLFIQRYFGEGFKVAMPPLKVDTDEGKNVSSQMGHSTGQDMGRNLTNSAITSYLMRSSELETQSMEPNLKRVVSLIPIVAANSLNQIRLPSTTVNVPETTSSSSIASLQPKEDTTVRHVLVTEENNESETLTSDVFDHEPVADAGLHITDTHIPIVVVPETAVVERTTSTTQTSFDTSAGDSTQAHHNSVKLSYALTCQDAAVSPMASLMSLSSVGSSDAEGLL